MNCIYVADAFRAAGMETEVYTPFVCGSFTELFSKDKAVRDLEAGKVVFLQEEPVIHIFQLIHPQRFVQLRLKQTQSFWQNPLTVYMTVILRSIRLL